MKRRKTKPASPDAAYSRKKRRLRMQQGLCVQCGGPRQAGVWRCDRCNYNNRERLRISKALSRERLRAARGYSDVRDRPALATM